MKVTTEVESHEQKEKGETVQAADSAVDLSKFTSEGMLCQLGGQVFVSISWACKKQAAVSHSSTKAKVKLWNTVPRTGGLLALKFLDTLIDVLESLASRARDSYSRQLKPKTLKARQESSDRATTKYEIYITFLSFIFLSRSIKLQ